MDPSILRVEWLVIQVGGILAFLCGMSPGSHRQDLDRGLYACDDIYTGTVYSHAFTVSDHTRSLHCWLLHPYPAHRSFFWKTDHVDFRGSYQLATIIVTFALESSGYITPFLPVTATIDDLLFILVGLGLNTSLMLAILTDIEENASDAFKAASALRITNRELQANQVLLQQAREQLEARVAQRTAELGEANQQLIAEISEREQSELRFRGWRSTPPTLSIFGTFQAGTWTYHNRSQFLDHSIEDLIGPSPFDDYLHPDDCDRDN